jgi:hypothetical protein
MTLVFAMGENYTKTTIPINKGIEHKNTVVFAFRKKYDTPQKKMLR